MPLNSDQLDEARKEVRRLKGEVVELESARAEANRLRQELAQLRHLSRRGSDDAVKRLQEENEKLKREVAELQAKVSEQQRADQAKTSWPRRSRAPDSND